MVKFDFYELSGSRRASVKAVGIKKATRRLRDGVGCIRCDRGEKSHSSVDLRRGKMSHSVCVGDLTAGSGILKIKCIYSLRGKTLY